MAKRRKALPARKRRDRSRDDDSVLLQSAESLGRLIGLLQRQLEGATRRLSNHAGKSPARTRANHRKTATRSAMKRTRAAGGTKKRKKTKR